MALSPDIKKIIAMNELYRTAQEVRTQQETNKRNLSLPGVLESLANARLDAAARVGRRISRR